MVLGLCDTDSYGLRSSITLRHQHGPMWQPRHSYLCDPCWQNGTWIMAGIGSWNQTWLLDAVWVWISPWPPNGSYILNNQHDLWWWPRLQDNVLASVETGDTDAKTESGCCWTMEPDMTLDSSLGPDITMILGDNTDRFDWHGPSWVTSLGHWHGLRWFQTPRVHKSLDGNRSHDYEHTPPLLHQGHWPIYGTRQQTRPKHYYGSRWQSGHPLQPIPQHLHLFSLASFPTM